MLVAVATAHFPRIPLASQRTIAPELQAGSLLSSKQPPQALVVQCFSLLAPSAVVGGS